MGTRSTTKFYDADGFIGGFYRQYDGYISGHGVELKEILKGKKIINGFGSETTDIAFNGISCLGAWVIGKIKGNHIGGIYLTTKEDMQEYNYEIRAGKDGNIMIKIKKELYNMDSGDVSFVVLYDGCIDDMPEKETGHNY